MHAESTISERVEQALTQIRPYLEADSGNVSLLEVTDDLVVRLKFHGACSSCSMSAMTLRAGIEQTIRSLRAGIEQTIRSHVPEVKSVEAVDGD
ncbi:MAG: NifU family protein [Bacteroidetes bacterium]|nr:NifU family protein [Bacteroidota bacterium]